MPQPTWNLLQLSDVLDLELATALCERVPVLAWEPERCLLPALIRPGHEGERNVDIRAGLPSPAFLDQATPPLRIRQLPLLRGFARWPMRCFARTGPQVLSRLLRQTADPEQTPLVCTVPFFADVAERWPGPVVYWLTDLIAEYSSAEREQVLRLDRRLCAAATLLCPNSQRLANYMIDTCGADPRNIQVLPNATRASNLLPTPPTEPGPRPTVIQDVRGPIAGVIGNLAGNMDWLLLHRLVGLTPWLSWVFVGPTSMHIADPAARRAREAVMRHPQAHFVGKQPYGDLAAFARCFDVAVLPYRRCEPTYSGSSTRFYEHLAACRPMVATDGLEELTRKEPLLALVDSAEEARDVLALLRTRGFDDGLLGLRWRESQSNTWQTRARAMQAALNRRLQSANVTPEALPFAS